MKKILKNINFFFVLLIVAIIALFVTEKSKDLSTYDSQFMDRANADIPYTGDGDGGDGI